MLGFKASPLEAESEPESEPEPGGCEDVGLLRWRALEGSVLLDMILFLFFGFRFSVFGFSFALTLPYPTCPLLFPPGGD